MDNLKTGNLIRELRKEKHMTQKELADLLHITDRAVSKWERGVCAPDISLLDPLSKILEISVLELINGELETKEEKPMDAVKKVLDYSETATAELRRNYRKQMIGISILVFLLCVMGILTVNQFCYGNGFAWSCIPAYIEGEKAAKALENYDKEMLETSLADGQSMYDGLVKLEQRGIVIRDAKVSLSGVRLEDMFLFLEIDLVVEYQQIKYLFTCPGTYRDGKVELMHISDFTTGEECPKWMLELSEVLSTYNPG